MAHRGKGKYEKPGSRKKTPVGWILLCCILVLGIAFSVYWFVSPGKGVFQQVVADGYLGTQEQWLASLAGEEATGAEEKTAYALAVENGYRESEEIWLKTLTGSDAPQTGKSPYAVACEGGYHGSFSQWLTSIAHQPEKLGISQEEGAKTDYERACDFGFDGSFIEWLVSLTTERN